LRRQDFDDLFSLEDSLWWFVGMREITAALLGRYISAKSIDLILDAGCGTGGMVRWLAEYAPNATVLGIDVSQDAMKYACEQRNMKGVQASTTALPFADNTFDLVTSFDVLVQLHGEASDLAALREMNRVLRPRGIVFIRVAAYQWMRSGHDDVLGTQRRYTLTELSTKLDHVGFEVLRSTYANTFLLPAAIIKRVLLQRIGIGRGSDVRAFPSSLQFLNTPMTLALKLEAILMRKLKTSFPAGLSAVCVARKR